jgi:hypothetical protein
MPVCRFTLIAENPSEIPVNVAGQGMDCRRPISQDRSGGVIGEDEGAQRTSETKAVVNYHAHLPPNQDQAVQVSRRSAQRALLNTLVLIGRRPAHLVVRLVFRVRDSFTTWRRGRNHEQADQATLRCA